MDTVDCMMRLRIKRVYEPLDKADGRRILVDRLWPRGLSRDAAAIDRWLKELGPSTGLRKWFGHRPERWREFVRRYRAELRSDAARQLLRELKALAKTRPLTLLYAARDEDHNQAIVIADALKSLRAAPGRRRRINKAES